MIDRIFALCSADAAGKRFVAVNPTRYTGVTVYIDLAHASAGFDASNHLAKGVKARLRRRDSQAAGAKPVQGLLAVKTVKRPQPPRSRIPGDGSAEGPVIVSNAPSHRRFFVEGPQGALGRR
jgi:hypothetical protein